MWFLTPAFEPWQMHQSYLVDYRVMKRSGLADDGVLAFSRPGAGSVSTITEEQMA